tara:strand:+ start:346 stop:1104 length:759 start_codon:yes stop_codon:yes gene_type:complete
MAFPTISSTSNPIDLDDFKNLVKNFLENNESSFSTNLDVLIRVTEDFIWGAIGGYRTRFKSVETSQLLVINNYIDLSTNPSTSGNIKDLLSLDVSSESSDAGVNWSPVELRDYDFVTQAFPASTSTGKTRYYAIDPLQSSTDVDENQNTIRAIIAPYPDETYFYRFSYTKFPLSLVDVTAGEGTWISRNYISALLYGVLYHGYLYEKGDAQLLGEYKKLFQESMMLVGSNVKSQDTSEYEKGTGPGDGGGEI